MELMEASNQWRKRPYDERFTSLTEMLAKAKQIRQDSAGKVIATKALKAVPVGQTTTQNNGLAIVGPAGNQIVPTHWAFGQLCQRAAAPAGYFREQEVPAPLVADCINWGLLHREVEDVGVLLRKDNGITQVSAVTGPAYGRIWNADVLEPLIQQVGDGITGHFRVPGEFGKKVDVTKENTTLYMGDRDFFVFLADEERRIEVPNRRDGKAGSMARGFFMRNSEVGAGLAEIVGFIFDYACANRIVWGAQDVTRIAIRHTSNAPGRWIEEAAPALKKYAASSTVTLTKALEDAKKHRLDEDVLKFLNERFTKSQSKAIMAVHEEEEHRPIETRWDAVVGITAYAREIPWQDERIVFEKAAGKLLV